MNYIFSIPNLIKNNSYNIFTFDNYNDAENQTQSSLTEIAAGYNLSIINNGYGVNISHLSNQTSSLQYIGFETGIRVYTPYTCSTSSFNINTTCWDVVGVIPTTSFFSDIEVG